MIAPHILIIARAGTGKTTTLCWSVDGVPEGIQLSQEQHDIVSAVKELINEHPKTTIRFTAFSKAIATELQTRLPNVDCCTNHSLGLRTIKANCGAKVKVEVNKTWKLCEQNFGEISKLPFGKRKDQRELYNEIKGIVSITKATLTELDPQSVATTCDFYDVTYTPRSVHLALEILSESLELTNWIDFDDMIWLPAMLNMTVEHTNIAIVDECQDLNAAQLWLASQACDHLIVIGDNFQSIFGFAGADPAAMNRISDWMDENGGYQEYKLTETRRCGSSIVAQCQKFVPDFRAHPTNHTGSVVSLPRKDLIGKLSESFLEKSDVMVLCRTNAPLTRVALSLLKERIPVFIRGRKFAQGIMTLIKSFKINQTVLLMSALEEYENRETEKILKSNRPEMEQKLLDLTDKLDIIRIFSEGCETVQCILDTFDSLFSDDNKKNAICLSSAHRSKGLEADTIYLLHPELLPHPKLSEKSEFCSTQERNVAYVAHSRAKQTLVFVKETSNG